MERAGREDIMGRERSLGMADNGEERAIGEGERVARLSVVEKGMR